MNIDNTYVSDIVFCEIMKAYRIKSSFGNEIIKGSGNVN